MVWYQFTTGSRITISLVLVEIFFFITSLLPLVELLFIELLLGYYQSITSSRIIVSLIIIRSVLPVHYDTTSCIRLVEI